MKRWEAWSKCQCLTGLMPKGCALIKYATPKKLPPQSPKNNTGSHLSPANPLQQYTKRPCICLSFMLNGCPDSHPHITTLQCLAHYLITKISPGTGCLLTFRKYGMPLSYSKIIFFLKKMTNLPLILSGNLSRAAFRHLPSSSS